MIFAQADRVVLTLAPEVRQQIIVKEIKFPKRFNVSPVVHVSAHVLDKDDMNVLLCALVKQSNTEGATVLVYFQQEGTLVRRTVRRIQLHYICFLPRESEGNSGGSFVRINRSLLVSSFQVEVNKSSHSHHALDVLECKIPLPDNVPLDVLSGGKQRTHQVVHAIVTPQLAVGQEGSDDCYVATVLRANHKVCTVLVKRIQGFHYRYPMFRLNVSIFFKVRDGKQFPAQNCIPLRVTTTRIGSNPLGNHYVLSKHKQLCKRVPVHSPSSPSSPSATSPSSATPPPSATPPHQCLFVSTSRSGSPNHVNQVFFINGVLSTQKHEEEEPEPYSSRFLARCAISEGLSQRAVECLHGNNNSIAGNGNGKLNNRHEISSIRQLPLCDWEQDVFVTCAVFMKPFCASISKGVNLAADCPFSNFIVEEIYADDESECHSVPVFKPARKIALCVGNENYHHLSKLPTCHSDAQDMADLLQGLQFDVSVHLDVQSETFRQVVQVFLASIKQGDLVVLYYSGHGAEYHGKAALLGVDAPDISSKSKLNFSLLLDNLLHDMNKIENHAVFILIMDCCRFDTGNLTFTRVPLDADVPSTPNFTPKGSLQRGLKDDIFEGVPEPEKQEEQAKEPTLVSIFDFLRHPSDTEFFLVFSCDPGTNSVIQQGGRNSLFTSKWIESLQQDPEESLEYIANLCSNKMAKFSATSIQRPWYHSCLKQRVSVG